MRTNNLIHLFIPFLAVVLVLVTAPDGFRCDEQGNIFTSSNAGVEIFTPAGEYPGMIRTTPRAANVCFGGEGRKTQFITAREKLYKINLNVAGVRQPNPEN